MRRLLLPSQWQSCFLKMTSKKMMIKKIVLEKVMSNKMMPVKMVLRKILKDGILSSDIEVTLQCVFSEQCEFTFPGEISLNTPLAPSLPYD
mmetsp:Transcript_58823/g.80294  ORF Transcript_58823/g.80294 Transcript_58823/m.80294 type:complete len:91 (+) Transcript_58823:534-806(+)